MVRVSPGSHLETSWLPRSALELKARTASSLGTAQLIPAPSSGDSPESFSGAPGTPDTVVDMHGHPHE